MTAPEDTCPSRDNIGGAPTEVALIDYLQDAKGAVSLERLKKASVGNREHQKAHVKHLGERGLITVSVRLFHVMIQPFGGVIPITDGGRTQPVDDIDLTPEQIYTVLSNERRRETLRVLARQVEQGGDSETTYTPVTPLAAAVYSSKENITSFDGPITDGHHSVYVALTQTHLPLLHDLGAVEYYSRVQKVTPTNTGLALAQLMGVINAAAEEAME